MLISSRRVDKANSFSHRWLSSSFLLGAWVLDVSVCLSHVWHEASSNLLPTGWVLDVSLSLSSVWRNAYALLVGEDANLFSMPRRFMSRTLPFIDVVSLYSGTWR